MWIRIWPFSSTIYVTSNRTTDNRKFECLDERGKKKSVNLFFDFHYYDYRLAVAFSHTAVYYTHVESMQSFPIFPLSLFLVCIVFMLGRLQIFRAYISEMRACAVVASSSFVIISSSIASCSAAYRFIVSVSSQSSSSYSLSPHRSLIS